MQESQTEVARGRRLGSWHCFCQQTYMGPNMDLDFGRAEAKAAAGVGFRDRRRTRRRRRRRRKKGGGTRWPLRMACKTSKLTDSQPGSDMQSRQQEQIAAVGGCHSCPIWQAVKNRRGENRGKSIWSMVHGQEDQEAGDGLLRHNSVYWLVKRIFQYRRVSGS